MEAKYRTRSEVLAASLARANADLSAAREARALFDSRCCLFRDLAAEQTSPTAQSRYTNASVIQASMRDGQDKEISALLQLIERLQHEIAGGDAVQLNADQIAGMDDTLEAVL